MIVNFYINISIFKMSYFLFNPCIYFRFQFILSWLIVHGNTPEIIPNGSKVMCIKLKRLSIRVIDSINFLQIALGKLSAWFEFKELKKSYFPHLFNTRDNQNYEGRLPAIQFHSPGNMTAAARQAFLEWHKQHEDDEFIFQKEILEYCW